MNDFFKLIVDPRQNIWNEQEKLLESLKEISIENNIAIAMPSSYDEFLKYCRADVEHTYKYFNCYDYIQRVQRRRSIRHVPRWQRNMEPQCRKKYVGKRGMPSKETVQLLEQDGLKFFYLKNRDGSDHLEIQLAPSS
jgi:hypothetical protein